MSPHPILNLDIDDYHRPTKTPRRVAPAAPFEPVEFAPRTKRIPPDFRKKCKPPKFVSARFSTSDPSFLHCRTERPSPDIPVRLELLRLKCGKKMVLIVNADNGAAMGWAIKAKQQKVVDVLDSGGVVRGKVVEGVVEMLKDGRDGEIDDVVDYEVKWERVVKGRRGGGFVQIDGSTGRR